MLRKPANPGKRYFFRLIILCIFCITCNSRAASVMTIAEQEQILWKAIAEVLGR